MLPSFKEYLKYMHTEKKERCIKNGNIIDKVISYKLLIDELFDLQDQVNKDSTIYINDIAKEIATTYLIELYDW